ncbi:MAG: replication restart DNA helicase PriA [Cyanobacteriota bacterium]|nr:replication restart DNA helicase PriA [Cyanobacteriota bacterium]
MVRCPNCGEFAIRESFNKLLSDYINGSEKAVTKTECKACDYLMIMGSYDGKVLEAYAPGISFKIMLQESAI